MPAIQALGEGYEVYIVTDASGGVSLEAHEMAVQRMVQAGEFRGRPCDVGFGVLHRQLVQQHFPRVGERKRGNRTHHEPSDWQHECRGDDALNHSRDDLLGGDETRWNGGEQSVLDLLRPPEILHHR